MEQATTQKRRVDVTPSCGGVKGMNWPNVIAAILHQICNYIDIIDRQRFSKLLQHAPFLHHIDDNTKFEAEESGEDKHSKAIVCV
jgi:hypothetical protein